MGPPGEHADHGGRRVGGVMPVPQGVPLRAVDDGAQPMVLHHQSRRAQGRGAFRERRALVREVHHPEAAVDDEVGAGARHASVNRARGVRQPVPPCGLGTRRRCRPSGSAPSAPSAATPRPPRAGEAGSRPRLLRQSSAPASWASPHPAHSHICSGNSASGPGCRRRGTARSRAARPGRGRGPRRCGGRSGRRGLVDRASSRPGLRLGSGVTRTRYRRRPTARATPASRKTRPCARTQRHVT